MTVPDVLYMSCLTCPRLEDLELGRYKVSTGTTVEQTVQS